MNKHSLPLAIAASLISQTASADLISDSTATLEARNFYFNRDYRQMGASQSKSEEWAQGFILRLNSGYTEGTVGLGVDAIGMLGFKLDSGGGSGGSGLLVPDRSGGSQDTSSDLAIAAKAKLSKSTLRVGSMQFKNMAIGSSDSRLTPQVFKGGHLLVKEVDGLTLDSAYIREVNHRNSNDYQDLAMVSGGKRNIVISGANSTDAFTYYGGQYTLGKRLTAGYYYSNLDELYKQNSFNLVHNWTLGEGRGLKSDLRFARSSDDGRSNIDNRAFGAMFTYTQAGHSLGFGYQKMSGDTGAAYIASTDPFLVNYVQISDFANKDESSLQARYDYNFAALGIPGLTFMTRYLKGDNVDLGATTGDGKEWERDTELKYVFQQGALKNLSVRWRNAMTRSNFSNDLDENRLIVSYTLPLF